MSNGLPEVAAAVEGLAREPAAQRAVFHLIGLPDSREQARQQLLAWHAGDHADHPGGGGAGHYH